MNAEIKMANRFGEASLSPEQAKAMEAGVSDLLAKSMAAFCAEIRALKYFQIGILITVLICFAGLIFAILIRS